LSTHRGRRPGGGTLLLAELRIIALTAIVLLYGRHPPPRRIAVALSRLRRVHAARPGHGSVDAQAMRRLAAHRPDYRSALAEEFRVTERARRVRSGTP